MSASELGIATAQQEDYAQLLFQGKTQYEAFLIVRPYAIKWGRNAIDSNASRLARKVSVRVAELRNAVVAPMILSAIDRQEWWSGVTKSDATKMHDRLRASELLGKAQGDFVELKKEFKDIRVTIVHEEIRSGEDDTLELEKGKHEPD